MTQSFMAQIPPLTVLEPAAGKRRAAAVAARKESPPDLASLKNELGKLRRRCRDQQAALMEQYRGCLIKSPDVKWTVARDAAAAASYIKQVAGRSDLVSINKSIVVVNELRPHLQAVGLRTFVRYYEGFDPFENKVEDYWGLPRLDEKGLVGSFEVAGTFSPQSPGPSRDYVAVMGVNAVAADDGAVFFLQHMANISKDLEQAKKIVLVVTPEKIVPDRASALLQTKSMGVFGLESVLLGLDANALEKYDFEGLPETPGDRELHVVILDNGRAELLADAYQDLFLCIDCRACSRQCPIALHVGMEEMTWTPKNYLLGFLQGWIESTEACLHCGRCRGECPVDIDIPALIWRARFDHYARHGRSWKKRMLDGPERLARMGSATAPLSNWASDLSVCRWMMEAMAGVHHNAPRPTFHRRTFQSWVARRE